MQKWSKNVGAVLLSINNLPIEFMDELEREWTNRDELRYFYKTIIYQQIERLFRQQCKIQFLRYDNVANLPAESVFLLNVFCTEQLHARKQCRIQFPVLLRDSHLKKLQSVGLFHNSSSYEIWAQMFYYKRPDGTGYQICDQIRVQHWREILCLSEYNILIENVDDSDKNVIKSHVQEVVSDTLSNRGKHIRVRQMTKYYQDAEKSATLLVSLDIGPSHDQTPHQQFEAICKEMKQKIQTQYKVIKLPKNFEDDFDFETEMMEEWHWNIPDRWVQHLETNLNDLYIDQGNGKRISAEKADIFDMHERKLVTNASYKHRRHRMEHHAPSHFASSETNSTATRYRPPSRAYAPSHHHAPSSIPAPSVAESDTTRYIYQPKYPLADNNNNNDHNYNEEEVHSQRSSHSRQSYSSRSRHSSLSDHSGRSKHSHHSSHSNHSGHSNHSNQSNQSSRSYHSYRSHRRSARSHQSNPSIYSSAHSIHQMKQQANVSTVPSDASQPRAFNPSGSSRASAMPFQSTDEVHIEQQQHNPYRDHSNSHHQLPPPQEEEEEQEEEKQTYAPPGTFANNSNELEDTKSVSTFVDDRMSCYQPGAPKERNRALQREKLEQEKRLHANTDYRGYVVSSPSSPHNELAVIICVDMDRNERQYEIIDFDNRRKWINITSIQLMTARNMFDATVGDENRIAIIERLTPRQILECMKIKQQ